MPRAHELVAQDQVPRRARVHVERLPRVRPLVAELTLPKGARLITGKERLELTQLEGFCYKPPVISGYSADTTDDRARAEWTLQAPAGTVVPLTARHERAGWVRVEAMLT